MVLACNKALCLSKVPLAVKYNALITPTGLCRATVKIRLSYDVGSASTEVLRRTLGAVE